MVIVNRCALAFSFLCSSVMLFNEAYDDDDNDDDDDDETADF